MLYILCGLEFLRLILCLKHSSVFVNIGHYCFHFLFYELTFRLLVFFIKDLLSINKLTEKASIFFYFLEQFK